MYDGDSNRGITTNGSASVNVALRYVYHKDEDDDGEEAMRATTIVTNDA